MLPQTHRWMNSIPNIVCYWCFSIFSKEFVPSGRQQTLRHPGPLETHPNNSSTESDDFLLNKFKKVSLADGKHNEWWILRKVESVCTPYVQEPVKCEVYNRSYNRESIYKSSHSVIFDDSLAFRTGVETSFNKFGKRLSETSSFKISNKRLSVDSDQRNDVKLGEWV